MFRLIQNLNIKYNYWIDSTVEKDFCIFRRIKIRSKPTNLTGGINYSLLDFTYCGNPVLIFLFREKYDSLLKFLICKDNPVNRNNRHKWQAKVEFFDLPVCTQIYFSVDPECSYSEFIDYVNKHKTFRYYAKVNTLIEWKITIINT